MASRKARLRQEHPSVSPKNQILCQAKKTRDTNYLPMTSSLVIEDMKARFRAGQSSQPVYFYCTRSVAEPERSKPHAVLASILRQLSCVQPKAPILGPVVEKYRSQGEGFSSNGLDLDDSRDLIIRLIEDYSMTTIVVDALDECDPLMRQNLLDAFEHILRESLGLVKIFVSSRNDQDIVCTLRDYPNMNISSDRNTADIEAYVKTETMKLVSKGQLLRTSRAKYEMATLIIKQISDGADGMFRWASLQLVVLRGLTRDEDIRSRLGKLPRILEELYLEVYDNLISAQDKVGRSIIDNTLKWLLCAKKNLHASEFLIAVAVNLDTLKGDISVDELLDLCNNLVLYDEAQDVFRFSHLSVREFLEKRPEFTEASCNSLAAECCLLQIIACSNCPNTEHFISDAHFRRLRQSPSYGESSSSVSFLEYANDSWMKYYQSIPLSDRLVDSNFSQTLRFFFSDMLGTASPLNAWLQWYCNRLLEGPGSAARWKLQETLAGCSESLSKSFFVAAYYGFCEIVTSCVIDRRLGDEEKDRGLLLAAMTAQHQTFDIISQNREEWAMTEPLLLHAVRALDKGRLAWLLDKSPVTMITNRVFAALAEDWDDGKMTILLNKYPDLLVTERMLEIAVDKVSLTNFELLVARAAKPVITEHMLQISRRLEAFSLKWKPANSEKIMILLGSMDESSLTPNLIASSFFYCDEVVIEVMLDRGGTSNITENVVTIAALRGPDIFRLVLQKGGKVTDTVLDSMASRCDASAWKVLLEQGYDLSVNMERLKLAAGNLYHGEAVLSLLLAHADKTALVDEMAGLIREVASDGDNDCIKLVLDHAKDVEVTQDMVLAAMFNLRLNRLDRVKMFLDRSSKVQISEDMLIAAASDYDGFEMTRILLERGSEVKISEFVLMAATCNRLSGYDIMQLLLEQDISIDITQDILISAVKFSSPDLVMDLLERSEVNATTGCLLEAAASNLHYGGELVRLLIRREKVIEFPEAVFIQAVGSSRGMDVILVVEEIFGRINLTESLLAKCVQRASPETIGFLLSRVDPVHMTEEVWTCAMKNDGDAPMEVQRAVIGKSLHIVVTIDILVMAAQRVTLNLFRFLWGRCRGSSVPEDLMNAAAMNRRHPYGIMEFLVHEADFVEVGEATLIAIMVNMPNSSQCFDLLLEKGLQADTTDGVPETLLINGGIKVKCSSAKPLRISKGMKVTEELFQTAASFGDENYLDRLSEFCELEKVPEKWLDVARFYIAATWGYERSLKILLECGVTPNVASLDGRTPLVQAASCNNKTAVELMLSAGALPDGGPDLKSSPLCHATDYGFIEMAKILVNAGASLTFKDEKGRTPSMIAKSKGEILIFKYLEQCRKEQERKGREASSSQ